MFLQAEANEWKKPLPDETQGPIEAERADV